MYSPSKTETEILKFWEKNKIFQKLIEKNKGKKKFRFIDGPITANNPMGVHHAYARTLKDLYQRYRALQGFDQKFQNGFDCHGLPVEVEVEKELGIHTKHEIEKYGIKKFIEKCKERVDKMSKIQKEQSIRLGQWMNWDNSYFTMSDNNIIHIWHFLKKCHENKWIYKGAKVLPWCIRCATSLSQHEVAQGYKDLTHTAVFIQVPIKNRKNEYLLLWTTTVWTLTSNVAAAVNPEGTYVKAKKNNKIYYLSKGTVSALGEHEILEELKGKDMLDWEYTGPYDELPAQEGITHKVVPWELVSEEDGTGIVHIAPGCGAEDFDLGKELNLPVVAPLDEYGDYIDGFDWLTGRNVKTVLMPIMEDLEKKDILFKEDKITHSYPTCWRCKEELVFRMTDAWFINVQGIRPRMKREAKKVFWSPELGGKLMDDWLNNMHDWNISRLRYWGLPLPFWNCECGELTVVGSLEELKKLAVSGIDKLKDIHKPEIDDVLIKCPKCKKKVKRVPEVGDCWLDAGIVPYSTLNYLTDKKYWKEWFPAEFISEMREQVRLWFYSLLFMSVTLENKAPYEKVLLFEKVYDEKAREMHKSGENVIWLEDAFEKMGADVMRWLYVRTNLTQNVLFGYSTAKDITKNLDYLFNIQTYTEKYLSKPKKVTKLEKEDKWILSRLESTKQEVYNNMEKLLPNIASRSLENFFINDLSRTYIKIVRNRLNENKELANLIYYTLFDTIKMMAPFTPFLTEKIYQDMFKKYEKLESIHLCEWPKADKKLIDKKLEERMEIIKSIVESSNALRIENKIKLKYTLPALIISGDDEIKKAVKDLKDVLLKMANVKDVKFSKLKIGKVEIKLNYKTAGKKFGKDVKKIETLLKDAKKFKDKMKVGKFTLNKEDVLVREIEGEGKSFGTGRVNLDLNISNELKEEWLVRELVRAVQAKRKKLGLVVKDKVKLYLSKDFKKHKTLIEKATNSNISFGKLKEEKESFEFEGKKIEFSVEK